MDIVPYFQIRVNSVNPTIVLTTLGRKGWSDPVKKGKALEKIPIGRLAGIKTDFSVITMVTVSPNPHPKPLLFVNIVWRFMYICFRSSYNTTYSLGKKHFMIVIQRSELRLDLLKSEDLTFIPEKKKKQKKHLKQVFSAIIISLSQRSCFPCVPNNSDTDHKNRKKSRKIRFVL